MASADGALRAAEQIAGIAESLGIPVVVIGATAMAAHRYIRHTDDVDLGVNASIPSLRALRDVLEQQGFEAALREPDADDPLGGVIDVAGDFGMVQLVNFGGRFPAAIDDAAREATLVVREGSPLRLAPLPQLVALKLYAGGFKSKADIVELLRHNPDANLQAIADACRRYGLSGLDELVAELKPR